MEELNQLSLSDLKNLAKEKGLKITGKNKKDIIEAIMESMQENREVKDVNYESANYTDDKQVEDVSIINCLEEPKEKGYDATNIVINNKDDFIVEGVLEVLADGYGFIRGENYLSTNKDVYVSPTQIGRFRLATGDKLKGIGRMAKEGEKFPALIYVNSVNGDTPSDAIKRKSFDDLTPIFPNKIGRAHV